jgi:transposase
VSFFGREKVSDKLNELLQSLLDEVSSLKEQQAENEKLLTNALSKLEQLTGTKSNVVSTGEAALMLGVSIHTIREWSFAGKIPKNIGVGKHLKFEREAIEKMTKAQKTGRPRKAA